MREFISIRFVNQPGLHWVWLRFEYHFTSYIEYRQTILYNYFSVKKKKTKVGLGMCKNEEIRIFRCSQRRACVRSGCRTLWIGMVGFIEAPLYKTTSLL